MPPRIVGYLSTFPTCPMSDGSITSSELCHDTKTSQIHKYNSINEKSMRFANTDTMSLPHHPTAEVVLGDVQMARRPHERGGLLLLQGAHRPRSHAINASTGKEGDLSILQFYCL